MIVLDPLVGVIILVCAVAAPVVVVVGSRLMKRRSDAWMATYRSRYTENLDAVQGMATFKAFNASRRRGAQLHERAEISAAADGGGYQFLSGHHCVAENKADFHSVSVDITNRPSCSHPR